MSSLSLRVRPEPRAIFPDLRFLGGKVPAAFVPGLLRVEAGRAVAVADRPDYRAIAEVTGMKVTAVGVTRGRCLAKLRALLDDEKTWEWA